MKFPVWAVVPAAGFAAAAAIVGGLFWQSSQRSLPPEAAPAANVDAPVAKASPPPAVAVPAPPAPVALASPPAAVVAVKPESLPSATAAPPSAPTFDVVRVEPTGETVVAGRGLAGARIALVEGGGDGKVLVDGVVDANGQFVLLPPPLAQGDHVLVLRLGAPDGSRIDSPQNVAVSVADKAKGGVLVALAEPGKATVILSDPGKADASTPVPDVKSAALPPADTQIPPAVATPVVSIRTAEVETGGGFFATGQAAAGADLRLYLNNSFVAAVKTGENGSWSLKIAKGMQPGHYAVRADLIDPNDGSVVARAEVPFDFPAPAVAAADVAVPQAASVPVATPAAPAQVAAASNATPAVAAPADVIVHEIKTATVVRGDSLWRISRKVLGKGIRYTQIYEANTQQIRDPRLIHIGQILVIPDTAKP